jgi:hypothetical protein
MGRQVAWLAWEKRIFREAFAHQEKQGRSVALSLLHSAYKDRTRRLGSVPAR